MIQHKKVEFVELFYDLVFVYAISQITGLIHHLHNGVVSVESFLAFAISLILYINTWMFQTVFINRFGISSFRNIAFLFIQMFLVIMESVDITNDWSSNFVSNMWPIASVSLVLLIQYIIQYVYTTNETEKSWIRPYFTILGARTFLLFIALCFPYSIGIIISTIGILLTWILPGIMNKRLPYKTRQIFHFPHLVERLSLLTIIMFGEMIIGIVPYFKEGFTWIGLFSFFTIAHLFISYIVEFDHMIDTSKTDRSMLSVIYWHYSIYFGLSLVTVGLGFIGEVGNIFAIGTLYIGLLLVLLGVMAHSKYNKPNETFTPRFVGIILSIIASGCVISFAFINQPTILMIVVFITTSIIMSCFLKHHFSALKRIK